MHPTRIREILSRYFCSSPPVTPEAFAIEACAPGRYVLNLGEGHNDITAYLKRKLCHVTAVSYVPKRKLERSTSSSTAPCLPENAAWFDQILLMDLIEQLDDAETFLKDLRQKMARHGAEIIIAVNNGACCVSRMMRAFFPFNLRRVLIPAIKPRHPFTVTSLQTLLDRSGYEIVELRGVPAPFPATAGESRWSRILIGLNRLLLTFSKRLFAYQICVRARPLRGNAGSTAGETIADTTMLEPQMLGRVA